MILVDFISGIFDKSCSPFDEIMFNFDETMFTRFIVISTQPVGRTRMLPVGARPF